MKYNQRLRAVKHYVAENFIDVSDVVGWMGITIEDVMEAFPDILVDKYEEIKEEIEAFEDDDGSGNLGEDEEARDY